MTETSETLAMANVFRPHERPCPSCGYLVHWHDGEDSWATCANCDLPVAHFGVYDQLTDAQRRIEALRGGILQTADALVKAETVYYEREAIDFLRALAGDAAQEESDAS